MRILHLVLGCYYMDKFAYQENELSKQNKTDGHVVQIITSTEVLRIDGKIEYTRPSEYFNENGIKVIRLPYRNLLFHLLTVKVRSYKGLYSRIVDFRPDVILFHDPSSYDILTAARYKRNHNNVVLLCDFHSDYNNSARGFISKYILHKCLYNCFIHCAINQIDKVFYITAETKIFLKNIYNLNDDILDYMPLGGNIYDDATYYRFRSSLRVSNGINIDDIVFIHSGKFSKQKKTVELLDAFTSVHERNIYLFLIGHCSPDVENKVLNCVREDNRIRYFDWKSAEELNEYLCAGDVYISLGGQSNTTQSASCHKCAVALFPYKSHDCLFQDAYFRISNKKECMALIGKISNDKPLLEMMRSKSYAIATRLLCYKEIAKKIYSFKK